MHSFSRQFTKSLFALLIFALLISACALPNLAAPTPQPAATPTLAPQTLPPTVVETDPPLGSQIGLQTGITIYFNQPMDKNSVEAAWSADPDLAGTFAWADDATLTFTPSQPIEAGADLTFSLSAEARAANGIAFQSPVTLRYAATDALRPVQFLPEPDAIDVRADAAVVAAFNQPVVPLGADSDALPAAFTLAPAVEGRGEWLNTSTYIFYPQTGMLGGQTYLATLNEDLVSVGGAPLERGTGAVAAWSFKTDMPRMLQLEPSSEQLLPLDGVLTLTFNQPMDTESVAHYFSLRKGDEAVNGSLRWNDDFTVLTFTPDALLERDSDYTLLLSGQAQARGGTLLGAATHVTLRTFPDFAVESTAPESGAQKEEYGGVRLSFNAPLAENLNFDDLVSISPAVAEFGASGYDQTLYVNGYFAPNTQYTLTISGALEDVWGQTLGSPYTLRFSTANLSPQLLLPYLGTDIYFTSAAQPEFYVQATNIDAVDMTIGSVPLNDFFELFSPNSYQARQDYVPTDALFSRQPLELTQNKSQAVSLPLGFNGGALSPGMYFLKVFSDAQDRVASPVYLVASDVQLVFKVSATDSLVWATDLVSGAPVAEAAVTIYDENGVALASGQTNAQGYWHGSVPEAEKYYQNYYAVIGQPGEAIFSLASSTWNNNLGPWRFGLPTDWSPPHTEAYLYTDRPIYRPGQTVYFRAIVRDVYDGRYTDSGLTTLPLQLSGADGDVQTYDLPLSEFGSANSSFTLSEDAQPGYYNFHSDDSAITVSASFLVADYRKPEINLEIALTPTEAQAGQPLRAEISARYFFDAPAGDIPVSWALYDDSAYFSLSDYRVGPLALGWLRDSYDDFGLSYYGETLASGEAQTDRDGLLQLDFSDLKLGDGARKLTLEVTAQDDSGQQISARSAVTVHPEEFYIGLRSDLWVGRAETELGFDVYSADWRGDPAPDRSLRADFRQVTWERQDAVNPYASPTYTPVYTPVGSVDFVTGADGRARLSFTPPQAGTYSLKVTGGNAESEILLWVQGAGQAVWPNLPNQRLRLTADRDSYVPGDTAQIFIPNPLAGQTQALVTVERGNIHAVQIIQVEEGGSLFSLPLTEADAPNIYLSAVLLGDSDFRMGYVAIEVAPSAQTLNVALTSQPARSEPGGEVVFGVQVTDSAGAPVKGEFSLAVVDLAALQLAEPNSLDIVDAFYSRQPLGVQTALSLAADSVNGVFLDAGGRGGGGGDEAQTVLREDFPDTAFWDASIVTDANGMAQVSLTLPDTLTTWQVDARGLTTDTRVGSARMELVSSKDVLIRPVTPRFMTVGDHVEMAAIVHNNTSVEVSGTVTLQAIGFLLDDPNVIEQQVSVPAGGKTRVSWWGTAQDADAAELIFASQFGENRDVTRPIWGTLPILHYTAPQSFVSAGTLTDAATQLEVISLPRTFVPSGGRLEVELAPSLAAVILDSLEAIPAPSVNASNEAVLSYLLPNLESYQALQAAGLDDPALKARLESTLDSGVRSLLNHQNSDGGWGWYADGNSQPYISAYILFGLWRARAAGVYVDETVIASAREYLTAANSYLSTQSDHPWQIDKAAFMEFAMQMTGGANAQAIDLLYERREQLSPWAQALLALAIRDRGNDAAKAASLLSNLETAAIRSASGAHWESENASWRNPGTPNYATSVVIFALAQSDPNNPLLSDAVRYLAAHRNMYGYWNSTYENAWSLLALTEVMKNSGELNAKFNFSAELNGSVLVTGHAEGAGSLTPLTGRTALDALRLSVPNALTISRDAGLGRLYYRAALLVERPAETAAPVNRGMTISREFLPVDCGEECLPLNGIQLTTGAKLQVRLTLNLSQDAYYVMVEDHIPAGAEILNQNLKTSQLGGAPATEVSLYAENNPFARGWGWWLFDDPQIYDDHLLWTADYLPAGTYALTYTLIPLQAGEYRVIPARAWQAYFPEVQGSSAGELFTIRR